MANEIYQVKIGTTTHPICVGNPNGSAYVITPTTSSLKLYSVSDINIETGSSVVIKPDYYGSTRFYSPTASDVTSIIYPGKMESNDTLSSFHNWQDMPGFFSMHINEGSYYCDAAVTSVGPKGIYMGNIRKSGSSLNSDAIEDFNLYGSSMYGYYIRPQYHHGTSYVSGTLDTDNIMSVTHELRYNSARGYGGQFCFSVYDDYETQSASMTFGTNSFNVSLLYGANIIDVDTSICNLGANALIGMSKSNLSSVYGSSYLSGTLINNAFAKYYASSVLTVGGYRSSNRTSVRNGLRVSASASTASTSYPTVYLATTAITGSSAGVAELFEWLDGNPDQEDRLGHFVTLDGEKIRYADETDDYILGIVDPMPFALGDSGEEWHEKYLHDAFGRNLTEKVFVPKKVNDNGEVIWEDHYDDNWIINPDYDESKEYVPRHERKEYAPITSKGKVTLIDDGTCQVNKFATVGPGGIATHSDDNVAVRVLKRFDENHIRVFIDSSFMVKH